MIADRIVGTAEIETTSWSLTVCQNVLALKPSHMTISQPTISGITYVAICALAWKSGRIMPSRSPGPIGTSSAACHALASTLAWLSIAPLGCPVVPDV